MCGGAMLGPADWRLKQASTFDLAGVFAARRLEVCSVYGVFEWIDKSTVVGTSAGAPCVMSASAMGTVLLRWP